MREICVERRYAMTSGMTLLLTGCIGNMSHLRRLSQEEDGGQGSNQATSSHVRKNLFGPIDHDESRKFVQDELTKISRADTKRWNFDFQSGVPKEGRYMWEKMAEEVPQAYDLSRMPFLSVHAAGDTTTTTPAAAPTTTTTTTTIPTQQQQQQQAGSRVEEAVASSQPSTSALHKPSTSTQITTTTTIIPSPPTITASPPTTIPGPTTTIACPAPTIVCPAPTTTTATTIQVDPTATTAQTTTTTRIPTGTTTTTIGELVVGKKCGGGGGSVVEQQQSFRTTRQTKPTQTPITEYMKIQRRGVSRKREDDQPPALVKRPKTTTS